jgi:hypothetical protein
MTSTVVRRGRSEVPTKTEPKPAASAKSGPAAAAASQPPLVIDESTAAVSYSNFVAANVTPVDFNLMFGQAGVGATSPAGVEIPWPSHVKYVAKITLPLPVLIPLIKLLEAQLDRARAAGVTVPEVGAEEAKP